MIILFLITRIEVYVMAAILAAGVIALCVRPSGRGTARQWFVEGVLCRMAETVEAERQSVKVVCLENGDVLLTRCGLPGPGSEGTVSLVATLIGSDLLLEERIVEGGGEPVDMVLFTLDFLGRMRYHVRYVSEATSTAVAFTLSNREGMELEKVLAVNS